MWSDNQHETIFIGWRKHREGWVKLNCDGSQNDRLGLAGCGGLLRNSDDNWLKGYSRKLGNCDALHAEMWGMYLGLGLARREGIMHLHVESDSKVLIDMVTKKINFKGNMPTLFIESPPGELQRILFDDISGACMPRNVRLTL
ncbi:hypothetical protein TSUD_249000 [Trifolium subterraneum]|uniref:RNase H type-1 domain-containing protein n=1 Tax=Trifolium subterraneum TaxID=3900 RepID=A0A2Z6M7L6_TRISU|nr:hypothetical protein TSUD_249000 [Trifolium subterraneum]